MQAQGSRNLYKKMIINRVGSVYIPQWSSCECYPTPTAHLLLHQPRICCYTNRASVSVTLHQPRICWSIVTLHQPRICWSIVALHQPRICWLIVTLHQPCICWSIRPFLNWLIVTHRVNNLITVMHSNLVITFTQSVGCIHDVIDGYISSNSIPSYSL